MEYKTVMRSLPIILALVCAANIPQIALAEQHSNKSQVQGEHYSASATTMQATELSDEQKAKDIYSRAQIGPKTIKLGKEGELYLPKDMLFIAKDDANQLMKMAGNPEESNRYGLIVPKSDKEDWSIDVVYVDSGHVADDDAKNWNVDELLKSIKEGTNSQNNERIAQGNPTLYVLGWVEKPHYDAVNHRLIWALEAIEKGKYASKDHLINYHAYVLGRKGYIDMTLMADKAHLGQGKVAINNTLEHTIFLEGLRYQDFDATSDKMAEFGIAALIGGVAAKKLGLLAIIGAFFVKFFKIIAIGAVAVFAAIRKFISSKNAKDFRQPEQLSPEEVKDAQSHQVDAYNAKKEHSDKSE